MTSPIQELMEQIRNRLLADDQIYAAVGNRIYDMVADGTLFPYVTFNTSTLANGRYDCLDLNDISLQIDVWSRAAGYSEASEISERIRVVLDDTDIDLPINTLCSLTHDLTQIMRDTDGLTTHGVIRLTAIVQSL